MAKRSANPGARKPVTTPGASQGRTNSVVADPLDLSPWGPGQIQPSQAEQQILNELGPAARAVLQFDAAIVKAITDGLDVTQAELNQVASDLQLALSAGMLPAASAIAQAQTALSNTIRGALQQAAEYTSAGAGTPITLQAAQGYVPSATTQPLHPEMPPVPAAPTPQHAPPVTPFVTPGTTTYPTPAPTIPAPAYPFLPVAPPGQAPGSPGVPPVAPVPFQPIPPTHPAPFVTPGTFPAIFPGTTGAPGPRPWDTASPTGPVAGSAAASAAAGISPASAAITAGAPASGGNGGGSGDCSPQPKAQTGPGYPPYVPAIGDKYISDGEYTYWFGSDVGDFWTCRGVTFRVETYSGSVDITHPTPLPGTPGGPPLSPTTPTPTPPPPTPTGPTPTPTPPTGPGLPPVGPFPGVPPMGPTTPTPTPPPIEVPTVPTTPPVPPLPPDQPIPTIPTVPEPPPYVPPQPIQSCPPGTEWQWDGMYWTCVASQPPPTPTPTPPQPPEQPTPSPAHCTGDTKQDPCWRAAPEMNEDDMPFHVTSSVARGFADKKAEATKVKKEDVPDVNFNPAMVDRAADPNLCDRAYQMNLIDEGNSIIDVLPAFNDIGDVFNTSMEGKSLTAKVANWTILAPLAIVIQVMVSIVSRLITLIITRFYTMNDKLAGEANQRAAFNLMNGICMGGLDRIKKIWDYQANFNYQTQVPSPEFAASAWLGNEIDECTFQAYVMAGDYKWEPYRKCIQAQKYKFTPLELITLDKRKKLARSDFATRLREAGSLHTEDRDEIEALFHQIPAAGDLIRFMMRDVENTEIVTTFQMDDGFTDNYQGKSKEWAEMQGLDDEIMQRHWRAHWSIPSPTQLYEMLHRLRHDPNEGGAEKVTEDVRKALKQQDILPYWIPKLMKISYHTLTRTDLNRAFERGWIKDDEYVNGMYNNGYSDDDAQTLLKFVKHERNLAIRHADFTTAYSHGFIDEDTLRSWAEDEGYEGDVLDQVVEVATEMLKIRTWEEQTKAIARQFRACRIDEAEALKDAETLGIPPEVIARALGIAELNSTCGTRREMASAVCQLLDQQLITPAQYVDRMKTLKFDEVAIQHMLQLCVNATARRRAQEAAKRDKELQRELEKEQKAEEKAAKDAQRAAEKAAKLIEQQERRRQTRNEQLMKAANKLGQYLQGVSGPPNVYVDSLYHGLQQIKGLSQDEAARVLVVTSSAAKGMTMEEFTQWTYEAAQAALTDPYSLFGAVPIA